MLINRENNNCILRGDYNISKEDSDRKDFVLQYYFTYTNNPLLQDNHWQYHHKHSKHQIWFRSSNLLWHLWSPTDWNVFRTLHPSVFRHVTQWKLNIVNERTLEQLNTSFHWDIVYLCNIAVRHQLTAVATDLLWKRTRTVAALGVRSETANEAFVESKSKLQFAHLVTVRWWLWVCWIMKRTWKWTAASQCCWPMHPHLVQTFL